LLAQGKRVLVTAHTDRALKEVWAKLSEAIRPLAVSVVGSTREDMSDLRVAVERIGAMAADHDPGEALTRIDRALRSIDDLRSRRAAFHDLLTAREDEVQTHEFAGYRGTLASIAREFANEAEQNRSLSDYVHEVLDAAPLHSQEIVEWHALLTTVCGTSAPTRQPPPCTCSQSRPETRFECAWMRSSPSSSTCRAVASTGWPLRSTMRAVVAPTCGELGTTRSSS
jgi:hypothetical protein